jgi:site-specific DNA recombinase
MMQASPRKTARCAIYTRKSTEHNLDLEFNSLDAQREACEAYIKSQAHEGWRLVRTRYDDGGLSGASLDRPALQELLGDVRARKVDIIVVYKVDRLTRSLADFAKLVELFDQHAVSFVSVTQSFNTTTSMGRLTLNVLLSFAQFEREVIGERVRDKIAASKRKGIWVGGPVPLGYASVGKKLTVVPEEAETVRSMFRLYLECGSVAALAEELGRRNIVSKVRTFASGRSEGGGRYGVGALAHFLKNRFYVGDVVYGGGIHAGEHEPILDRTTFDAVQAKLAENARKRHVRVANSPAILMGRMFDDRGNRMTPSHSNKAGVRYRYYISHALLQRRNDDAGGVARVPAPQVEATVVEAVRRHLQQSVASESRGDVSDREIVDRHVKRIAINPDSIEIQLREPRADEAAEGGASGAVSSLPDGDEQTAIAPLAVISVPWNAPAFVSVKGVLHQPSNKAMLNPERRDAILLAIVKARSWIHDLVSGRVQSFTEIAKREGKVERHVRLMAPLAFTPPEMLSAIIAGTAPEDLTVTALAHNIPYAWQHQA